jgi:MscS family membrane protein
MTKATIILIGSTIVLAAFFISPGMAGNDSTIKAAAVHTEKATTEKAIEADSEASTNIFSVIIDSVGGSIDNVTASYNRKLPGWVKQPILNIPLWEFFVVFIIILLGYIAKLISDFIFRRKLIPYFKKTKISFDHFLLEAASKPIGYTLFLVFLSLALIMLLYNPKSTLWLLTRTGIGMAFASVLLWFLCRVVDVATHYLVLHAQKTDSKLDDQLSPLFSKALKVTIAIIYILWVIQEFGYNISALLAGLGIGGLAVALALQDTLANLFGSIFIILDRPFRVGDRIVVDDVDGVVEEVGFRSTRIRTLTKTLVSIPNKIVAAVKVDNVTSMPKRKVVQTIGLTYETSAEQMDQARTEINKVLTTDSGVDQDFIVVRFSDFGDSSLNITVIYFTATADYEEYMAIKEQVNLAIMRAVDALGLSIAFPTRTVYLEGDIAKSMGNNR